MRKTILRSKDAAINADPAVVAQLQDYAYQHGLEREFLLLLGGLHSPERIKSNLDRLILKRATPSSEYRH